MKPLPTCQSLHLQAQVDRLYDFRDGDFPCGGYRYRKSLEPLTTWEDVYKTVEAETRVSPYAPIAFWIVTLCVLVQKVVKRYRKLAVRHMSNVYREADRVLVIDSWVQGASRQDHIKERAARVFMSDWQRRLWTLQESIFANSLCFQFRDGPQHRDDLIVDARIDVHLNRGFYHSTALSGRFSGISLPDFFKDQDQRTPAS